MTQAEMLFASAIATNERVDNAAAALQEQIQEQLSGRPPDLLVAFLSAHFTHQARHFLDNLRAALQPGALLGCTAEGVIGREREIEGRPAIALVAARLPGVTLAPFILRPADSPVALSVKDEFMRTVEAPGETRLFLMLGDPFTMPINEVLQAFNTFYPKRPMTGGMASGGFRPGGNLLFLDDQVLDGGAVGLGLSGDFEVDVIVSQGCRPIWKPMRVTAARGNLILRLDDRPPLNLIQELVPELSEEERYLLQSGLFVGRAVDSDRESLGRGDFLVRGVIGVDRQSGAIAIGDDLQEGNLVQFHLRDAVTAQEDLEMQLLPQMFRPQASGGLLFSCNGRGTRLYDHPDGDISVIQKNLGGIHLGGLFCAGEIGPVGDSNFLHGHTASLALFRPLKI